MARVIFCVPFTLEMRRRIALRLGIRNYWGKSAAGTRLTLRIAVDYSARAAIQSGSLLPDVDLLIRTGGEQRLSDFLLWECAYAELWFTDRMWPDFGASQLAAAIHEFHSRDRRFGGLPTREAV